MGSRLPGQRGSKARHEGCEGSRHAALDPVIEPLRDLGGARRAAFPVPYSFEEIP